ncbi:MAG TPA: chorismate mutase [Gemmatimonadaceae bacterium]|nr:chorismate mutase [Gemmatimonadaceae bacterium]
MLKSKPAHLGTPKSNGSAPARAKPQLMRVAFQGDRGAYGESAISDIWRHPIEHVPMPTFAAVVRAVITGDADACVIPVENSIVGKVDPGLHAIAAHPQLRQVGEVMVPVRHCLMAPRGATLATLKSAASHVVALAQCSRFFEQHPSIKPAKSFDTAGAAREVAERGDPTRAAIAGRAAAERYGLTILEEGIQDTRDNYTRFVALVSQRSKLWRRTHAIRGATSVERDDPREIATATRELLQEIIERNWLETDEIISCWFTVTPDLTSAFPALAAREMGWVDVPLLCASEIPVGGAMPRCLRVLVEVEPKAPRPVESHVYLREAVRLRPDISGART